MWHAVHQVPEGLLGALRGPRARAGQVRATPQSGSPATVGQVRADLSGEARSPGHDGPPGLSPNTQPGDPGHYGDSIVVVPRGKSTQDTRMNK